DGAAARAAGAAGTVIAEKRRADDAFYADVPLPVGDWPDAWRRGWIYDLETTRACIFPAGGIFHDEWPSWMLTWLRVVVAEGTLVFLRLSFDDPSRAMRLARMVFDVATGPYGSVVYLV